MSSTGRMDGRMTRLPVEMGRGGRPSDRTLANQERFSVAAGDASHACAPCEGEGARDYSLPVL